MGRIEIGLSFRVFFPEAEPRNSISGFSQTVSQYFRVQ